MNCDKCMHSGICSFEVASRHAEKSIPEVFPKNLLVGIRCKNFMMKFKKKEKAE
jgi:hypothetical protein